MAEESKKSQSEEKKQDNSKRDPSYAAATHDTDLMKPERPPRVEDEKREIEGRTSGSEQKQK